MLATFKITKDMVKGSMCIIQVKLMKGNMKIIYLLYKNNNNNNKLLNNLFETILNLIYNSFQFQNNLKRQ